MNAGRPPEGSKHVDRLSGADEDKQRLKVVLETISGEKTIEQACEALHVSPSRFHELRREALQAALDGLTPAAAGRPKLDDPPVDPGHVKALAAENKRLKEELLASYTRTEIALAMPHLLTPKARAEVKKKARKARKGLRRGSDGTGSAI
jgi:Helix-turn-helix domain